MSYPKELCYIKECKWCIVDKDYKNTVCEYIREWDESVEEDIIDAACPHIKNIDFT